MIIEKMKNIAESSLTNINKNLLNAYHSDVEWRGFYPLEDLKGLEALEDKVWRPLLQAFPDLERRNNIVIGGDYKNKSIVVVIPYIYLFDIIAQHIWSLARVEIARKRRV